MALRKGDAVDYLRAHGLVVEGDETAEEIREAYGNIRRYLRGRGLA